jgi:hypothetical protein
MAGSSGGAPSSILPRYRGRGRHRPALFLPPLARFDPIRSRLPQVEMAGKCRNVDLFTATRPCSPQRPLVHRNSNSGCGEQGKIAATSARSPQPCLIHRNLDLSAATWARSPQLAVILPQRRLVHRNLGLFTATQACLPQRESILPQRRLVHRSLSLFTATSPRSPQRRAILPPGNSTQPGPASAGLP